MVPFSDQSSVSYQVSPLFQKLEADQIEALKKKFGGQQVFDVDIFLDLQMNWYKLWKKESVTIA